jgi:hypothetical protein
MERRKEGHSFGRQAAGLQLQRFEFRAPPNSCDEPMKAAVRHHAGALLGLTTPIRSHPRSFSGRQVIDP